MFLFNSEIWNVIKKINNEIDAFQRKTLRFILNIKYPKIITTEKLNEIFNIEEWSTVIKRRRWRWLGHLIRLPDETSAKKALQLAEQEGVGRMGAKYANMDNIDEKRSRTARFLVCCKIEMFR